MVLLRKSFPQKSNLQPAAELNVITKPQMEFKMKNVLIVFLICLLPACANLQSPKETNIAVSTLLDELQIAIDEINEKTYGSSLPPLQSATIKLSTAAGKTTDGKATLVLSGDASKATKNSNTITLELVPHSTKPMSMYRSTGHEIAEYVMAAVTAINKNHRRIQPRSA